MSVYTTPRSILALQLMWAGDLEAAREMLEHELAEYERLGMYTLRQEVLCYLAELGCRAGRFASAASYAAEAAETVAESGMAASQTHVVRFNQALAAAYLGDVDASRRLATEGLELARANDDSFNGAWNSAVLGFLELSLGRFDHAHEHLAPVLAYLDRMDTAEPGVIPCVPDEVEALIALGRTDEARDCLEPFAAKARAQGSTLGRGGRAPVSRGARGRGAAKLDAARHALERRASSMRARRSRSRRLARRWCAVSWSVEPSRSARLARSSARPCGPFDALGARSWAARAEAELSRAGGDRDTATALTPTEVRVAKLVAEGKTNREVADALFVSVKTVEANLTRIFHKLGIRSRRPDQTGRPGNGHRRTRRVIPDSAPSPPAYGRSDGSADRGSDGRRRHERIDSHGGDPAPQGRRTCCRDDRPDRSGVRRHVRGRPLVGATTDVEPTGAAGGGVRAPAQRAAACRCREGGVTRGEGEGVAPRRDPSSG